MEIELKVALKDPHHLDRLLRALPAPAHVLEQRNHYFTDAGGRLSASRTMVRLREEFGGPHDRVVLTLKRRLSKERGVFVAEEVEEDVPRELWEPVLQGRSTLDQCAPPALQTILRDHGLPTLLAQGRLLNRRHVVPLQGFVLEIDQTTFDDGHVDVEIEVETVDVEGARALVETILADAGIESFIQTTGKYARFLARQTPRAS